MYNLLTNLQYGIDDKDIIVIDSTNKNSMLSLIAGATNWALKDFTGLTDLGSTGPYVKTEWKGYPDKMLEIAHASEDLSS